MRTVRLALLGSAVAVAFADSSIVVLALPELLGRFDTSVVGIAWVVTSYNLAVLAGALVLIPLGRRLDPRRLTRLGLLVFLAGSLACAVSPSIWTLVGWRAVQGLGGAALLAGSLPLMRSLASNPKKGTAHWALAGALGAALGPAAGGALTEIFDWRAIFLAQAPLAAVALLATAGAFLFHTGESEEAGGGRLRRGGANAALALLSGALVGALFLGVVVLIEVWGYTPLGAATIVSALPVGTLAARLLGRRVALSTATALGGLLLACGLAALALVPQSRAGWMAAGLALCGLGLGVAVPGLSSAALERSPRPSESATWSIASRHVGLVGGLLLLTPLLAHDLTVASARAQRAGTAAVLDSRISIPTKVPLAVDLANTIRRTPNGSLPDFRADFDRRRSMGGGRDGLTQLQHSLDETVRAVVTRGFRRALLLAGALALPVVFAVLWARRRRALVPAVLACAALLGAELGAGGLAYGAAPARDPCRSPSTVPGGGVDPAAQRVVLRGLDEAACRLGKSREQLVLDLAGKGAEAERWLSRTVPLPVMLPSFWVASTKAEAALARWQG